MNDVAVILERKDGQQLKLGCVVGGTFVPSFRVEGWSDTSQVEGTEYPGYDGEDVEEWKVRVSARTYTVRGWLRADTPEELEALLDQLQVFVNTKEELRLRRSETDDKFALVRKVSFAHDYVFKTGRRQCNVTITFKAADPYRYAVTESVVEEDITAFRTPVHLLEVQRQGTAVVEPVIIITGRTISNNPTRNPRLTNYHTGRVLQYTGELQQDEVLILDTAQRRAWKIPNAVEHAGLAVGGTANTITLAATASSQDGSYVGQVIKITSGTGAEQIRRIIGYHGASRTATVGESWDTIPNTTSGYEIYRAALLPGLWITEAQHGSFSGGVSVLASMSADYAVYGFPLEPGLNQIEVEGDTQHLKVTIVYRERWY